MGKIIRNGIEFSGACEDATAINYNNSLSGLEAQTVQEAVDELNDSLGGYKLTTIDGKIAYYKESEGADSATPFSSNNLIIKKVSKTDSTIFTITDIRFTTAKFIHIWNDWVEGFTYDSTFTYNVASKKNTSSGSSGHKLGISINGDTVTVDCANVFASRIDINVYIAIC